MADFTTVGKKECREAKLPDGCRLGSSRTVVLQSVINEIKEHGRTSMHKEVCGVLVGSLCWDQGPYLLIDARIEGKYATHQSGSVTFTSETWDFIHEELQAKHPGRSIVGWYHTHPGFGIFLSNMDAFIHDNFFPFPWSPAYVFDPQAETDGFFFRVGTELVREEVAVVPDVPPSVREPVGSNSTLATEPCAGASPSRAQKLLLPIAAAAAAVVIICCFATLAVMSRRGHPASVAAESQKVQESSQVRLLEERIEALEKRVRELELQNGVMLMRPAEWRGRPDGRGWVFIGFQ